MRPFSTIFFVVLLFRPFSQNGRLFLFLRNIHSSIEILKIKTLEYSYPPSQYFFVTKAFIRLFLSRRKVALCQSGRMAQCSPPRHCSRTDQSQRHSSAAPVPATSPSPGRAARSRPLTCHPRRHVPHRPRLSCHRQRR